MWGWGDARGEGGKLVQLAALSRTHQGESERGRGGDAVEEAEEEWKNGGMDEWMRKPGRYELMRRIQLRYDYSA